MANNGRRSVKAKKGPTIGTGGHGRKALEGKGPTPKAEDRPYHKAHKSKQLAERSAAKRGTGARSAGASRSGPKGRATEEVVTGRNSVVEALRAGIPAKALHIAIRIEMDDRVKESLKIAAERGIPLLETGKPELDRMTDDAVHQGLVLQIPPYEYQDAYDLAEETVDRWKKGHVANAPLFVALDGITDPRNLGAIIRSVSAFSGHGVIVPERRSVGVTASAWKTSAGAVASSTRFSRTSCSLNRYCSSRSKSARLAPCAAVRMIAPPPRRSSALASLRSRSRSLSSRRLETPTPSPVGA